MESIQEKIQDYLEDKDFQGPLFIALDTPAELEQICKAAAGCETVRLNDFCRCADAAPDTHAFVKRLRSQSEKTPVLALGVDREDDHLLGECKALFHRGWPGKIVLPLWKGHEFVNECRKDPRFGNCAIALPQRG